MSKKLRIYESKSLFVLFLMTSMLLVFSCAVFADDVNYIQYDFESIELTMFVPDNYECLISEEDVSEEDLIEELKTVIFVEDTGESVISLDYVVYEEGILNYGYLDIEEELIDLADLYYTYGFDLEQLSPLTIYSEWRRDSGYIMFDTIIDDLSAIMIVGCALGDDYYSSILFFVTYDYFFAYMDEIEIILTQFLFTDEIQTYEGFLMDDIIGYLLY